MPVKSVARPSSNIMGPRSGFRGLRLSMVALRHGCRHADAERSIATQRPMQRGAVLSSGEENFSEKKSEGVRIGSRICLLNVPRASLRCQYILESVFNAAPVDGVYRREVRFDWTQAGILSQDS
eukprot:5053372-Amphidinium_carterae.3